MRFEQKNYDLNSKAENYYYQLLEVEKYLNVTLKQFWSILVMIWTI